MKKFCSALYLSAMLWCAQANAQTVTNGWVIEDIHGPSQVGIVDTIPVDINQDGKMDVVSASIEDGHLRAYINQGNYQFEQQYISKEVPGIYRVSATDINNDGLIDFLYPSIETHEITILINQTSHYKKQIIASDIILPTDAQGADFNQDGLMDVVSISFENNQVLMHLQQVGGTFNTESLPYLGESPRKIQVGDFNNDGLNDFLLASSGDHSVRLYLNLGNNSFLQQLISNEMTGARYVAACDFNHDDLMDFVVSASDDNSVYLFANAGSEIFERKLIDNTLAGVTALYCADTDQDLQTELISVASSSGLIHTHELTGDFYRTLIANSRDGYITVALAAFETNDTPKILTQAHFENRNLLYSPNTTNQERVVWEDFPEGVNSIKYGDVNGDGVVDVVIANFRGDSVQWFDGKTNQKQTISNGIDGASEIFITDLDNDGKIDVLTAASYSSKVYFHKNLGKGLFKTVTVSSNVSFANGVIAVDVNGDTEKDIVVTSGTDDSVRWIQREGNDFIEHIIDSSNDAPNDVKGADIDNDGDIDLVVTYYFSDEISIYLNDSTGMFSEITLDNDFDAPFEIAIHHLNNDEYVDFVITGSEADLVRQYLSVGKLNYELAELISLNNPREVRVDIGGYAWISSPDEAFVIRIDTGLSNEIKIMVDRLLGVSDFDLKSTTSQFLISSFDRSYVFSVTKDFIFSNNFE